MAKYGIPQSRNTIVHVVTGIHHLVGPQDIVSSLEEITKPHKLGMHLGIETYKLEKIEENYP